MNNNMIEANDSVIIRARDVKTLQVTQNNTAKPRYYIEVVTYDGDKYLKGFNEREERDRDLSEIIIICEL